MQTIRLVHFSDLHITTPRLGWRRRDYLSKRVTGWLNLRLLGRGYRFRHANRAAAAMMRQVTDRPPDHLIFSGDATALAFEAEFAQAARLLGVGKPNMPPGLAVPGNHDYYVGRPVRDRLFERYFAPWQVGQRIDSHHYPFAQRVGHVWLIGVNSSITTFWTWDATGFVGPAQRQRLRQLLDALEPGPRILVTHYPLARSRGQRERLFHGLRDWREMIRIAAEGGVSLWLHGHIHKPFVLHAERVAPFPVICVGSGTQTHVWTYNEYLITGHRLAMTRRRYSLSEDAFHDQDVLELDLR
ncbi:MAG: metallophosphoesterase [Gemmataceae bacterium]|nr:metallophosphoesterase [Gemmataceae bacterium]